MSDLLKKAISLGWGLTIVSKEKIEGIVDDLVKRGELAPSESKQLVEKLIDKGAEEQGRFKELVNEQVRSALQTMGLASAKEVEELTRRVAELELEARRAAAAVDPWAALSVITEDTGKSPWRWCAMALGLWPKRSG